MAANLEHRINTLEVQSAGRWPGRPFAGWTLDQLQFEFRRLELGLAPSAEALAAMNATEDEHGNT